MKELIKKLVQTTGPSGYENQVRDLVMEEIKNIVDAYYIDGLGNLITRIGKKADGGKRVMLAAHLDEIGIMVTHIDDNGFARFTTIGGVFPRNTAGGRVRFLDGTEGVIGMEPGSSRSSVTPISEMFIDTGASSKKESTVKVGDVACFERTFADLGDRLVSKAMDDRIGVAVLIETLKQIKDTPNEVFGVFTVQEEVGVRGATAASFGVDPEIGLAIDVTISADTPKNKALEVALGKGPAIKIKDSGMLADPRVVAWMEAGAKRAKINYQREILTGGSTDARAIQITRSGVPAGCLSIPCRYVHSPSEMVDMNDVHQSVNLLVSLLNKPIKLS